MYVDRALEKLNMDVEKAPLFWKALHYLRNALIHHCPTMLMSPDSLNLLASMATKRGQIYHYFDMICKAKNTKVDLGGEKYKVFMDVEELATNLRDKTYSRDILGKKP
jgi:hypothetical protein